MDNTDESCHTGNRWRPQQEAAQRAARSTQRSNSEVLQRVLSLAGDAVCFCLVECGTPSLAGTLHG